MSGQSSGERGEAIQNDWKILYQLTVQYALMQIHKSWIRPTRETFKLSYANSELIPLWNNKSLETVCFECTTQCKTFIKYKVLFCYITTDRKKTCYQWNNYDYEWIKLQAIYAFYSFVQYE